MFRKLLSAFCAVAFICAPGISVADTYNVNNPAEFQAALDDAGANGQNDIINVNTCTGTGCVTVGTDVVYDIITPLTYTSSEGLSLTVDGFDSNTRILDGGINNNGGILFIDTSGASGDFGAEIVVKGLTFVTGNNVGDDGGALNIHVSAPRVEVSGSVFGLNAADGNGGALFIRAEEAAEFPIQVFDVTFDTNSAGLGGGGAHIAAHGSRFVEIYDVSFFDNDAANGGGLHVEGLDPADPVFERVSWIQLSDFDFDYNIARTGNGGGADLATVDLDVNLGGFVGNTASSGSGAGLYVRRNFIALDIVNAGFAFNLAGIDGGGFALEENDGPTITMTNNTIVGNESNDRGAGGLLTVGGSTGLARIYNNIIYDNQGPNVIGLDLYVDNDPFSDIPAMADFFNNNITDLAGFPDSSSYFSIVSSAELSSGNNLGGDPRLDLLTEQNPDPSQSQNSQTIDMGDNNAPGTPAIDFEGDPRPVDGDGDMTATVDIGIDEYVGGAVPSVDLSVTKTDSPDPATGGNDVAYTVTVTNNGPDDATGVTVVDTLDQAVTLVSAGFNQGNPCTTAGTPVIITCVLGDLAANNSAPGTIVVTTPVVTANSGIANTVSVSGNETDPANANNTAQQGTTVLPEAGPAQADLAVTKMDTPDPVFSGGPELTYTITINNNGPDTATGVTVTDTLPAGVTFVSANASAGQCDAIPDMSGDLTCGLGDLANGSNATVTIVVSPDVVGDPVTITNTATVTATEADPAPSNNTTAESTAVNPPSADMMIATSSTSGTPMINDPITYAVAVTNDGPSDNTGVVLTVTLPVSATFVSVTIDQGTCDVSDGTVSCTIGDLAAGATINATLVVTAPNEPMMLTLVAITAADVDDPIMGNNTDSEEVTVIDVIDLVIQGTSKGTGSIGWPTLLFLIGVAGLVMIRNRRRLNGAARMLLIGVIVVGFMLPLNAAQAQTGWYVGANLGEANLDYSAGDLQRDLTSLGWDINNPSVNDSGTAWKAYAGFNINEYVAFEAGYADLGKVVTQFGASIPPTSVNAILGDTFRIHPYQGDGWFGAAVLSWPVQPDRFTLFGRLGMIGWESNLDVRVITGGIGSIDDRESGTDTIYGVGMVWLINEDWSVAVEWERYKLNEWLDVPSLGIRFSF